ncbi:MAG TPA: retroviral-like aspartic protease family protein [Sphingomicrobium sp.]|nr:retroviral-like aspartic protease family protein [Sphingomicrobium sp.]
MMRQGFVALVALASSATLHAQPATTKLDAVAGIPQQDDKTQTEDVRFKNQPDDRMTVQVRLSGSGPYQFLVDTGADRTAISRDLAARLGLAKGEDAAIHTIAGVSTVSTATITDLELTKKPMMVRDAPLLDSDNMGADGILGVDSLRSQRVLFDFKTKTLSIVPSAVPDFRDEPGTIVVQAERKNGRLVVTDARANGRVVTVVIDTGAQLSIGNEELRKQLVGSNLVDANQQVQLQSVTGALISGEYMFVRELQIGGLTLKNLAIVFAKSHAFKELKLDRRPALLLGMNAIRAFKKVSIDFANRKFRVVLPETSQLDVRLAAARFN